LLRNTNGIERHVDSSRFLDNGVDMTCHGLFVESINLAGLGQPTGRRDLFGELGECVGVSSGEKYPAPSRAKARATAPPTAPAAP
jgi:hypothetical protein